MIGLARSVVATTARRGIATSRALSAEGVHPGYKTIKVKQEKFSVEDGTPIFVKGGAMDRILYGITMAACVGGVVWDCLYYYQLATK